MAPWKKSILLKYQKSAEKKKLFKSKHKAKKSILKKCKIIVDPIQMKSDTYIFGSDLSFERKSCQFYRPPPHLRLNDSMFEKHLLIDEKYENESESETEENAQIGPISYAVQESKFQYNFGPVRISLADFINHKFTPVEPRKIDYGIPEEILDEINDLPNDIPFESTPKKQRKHCWKSLKF